jgi:FdrA protein
LSRKNSFISGNPSGKGVAAKGSQGVVGVVSTNSTGLQEVAYLMAREGVGTSQAICPAEPVPPSARGATMLAALQKLQAHPKTEFIVLVSQAPPADLAKQILSQVRDSDKPTVVCLLGMDQRLVWRAGAIPAAAMRAVAWVRGWDQALVSSRLEEQDERLIEQAHNLAPNIGPSRHRLRGLFASQIFFQEAQSMVSAVIGGTPRANDRILTRKERGAASRAAISEALGDPELAVLLLDVVLPGSVDLDPAGTLIATLPKGQTGSIIVAHVCARADARDYAASQEVKLRDAGVIVAPSNAAAARLAGMIIHRTE